MISFEEAIRIIDDCAIRYRSLVGSERLGLINSLGRIASTTVVAGDLNPRFDASAMDGYLVRSSELIDAKSETPIRLKIHDIIAAGNTSSSYTKDSGVCYQIMTGAPLPDDSTFDAVIKREEVIENREPSGKVRDILVRKLASVGSNIRRKGEDFQINDTILEKGRLIDPAQIMSLSAAGVDSVNVFTPIRVSVITSGDELIPFDQKLISQNSIRDSVSPYLESFFSVPKFALSGVAHCPDDLDSLCASMNNTKSDRPLLIITSGGVSEGDYDFVKQAFEKCNGEVLFHKVAIRPGKPILFGQFRDQKTVFFGLPGNPVSVAVGLRFFVKRFLDSLLYADYELPFRISLNKDLKKPIDLDCFLRSKRDIEGAIPLDNQGSHLTCSLSKATGWIVVPQGIAEIKKDRFVDWYTI